MGQHFGAVIAVKVEIEIGTKNALEKIIKMLNLLNVLGNRYFFKILYKLFE